MALFDDETRQRLLRFVRGIVESSLTGRPNDRPDDDQDWMTNLPRFGVFVTLRNGPHLRGCIGTFDATDELKATLERMTLASLRDPRFRKNHISARELPEIRIELSLVSPMVRIADPTILTLGRDGIHIRQGSRSGCFLPDVATEQGWTVEEFLSQCCAGKAGLPPDAWRSPETEVHTFAVEKLAEMP